MLSCVRVRWMLSLLLLSACAPEPEAPAPPREGAEARGEPEEAAAAPPTHLVHEGIEVRVLEDGRVSVEGTDRWGAPLSITYADVHWFRGAIPVLSRSLMPGQAEALRAFGEELGRRGGT